jgi:hypothetical protein
LNTIDYKQDFVCVCDNRKSYGTNCERNTVPNPCLAAAAEGEQYYPFAFSAHAYVQCNGDILYVRPCAAGLYWNQEAKICDRGETAPAPPAKDQFPIIGQFSSNYDQQPQPPVQQPPYARPIATFADQSVDKQQGYRFRNDKPSTIDTDRGTSDGWTFPSSDQIVTRPSRPIFQSFYTPASLVNKINRRVQEKLPIDTYASNQGEVPQQPVPTQSWLPNTPPESTPLTQSKSIETNQQYGQMNTQQWPNSYAQRQLPLSPPVPSLPLHRHKMRVFQPESSRNFQNIGMQSSGYRRR